MNKDDKIKITESQYFEIKGLRLNDHNMGKYFEKIELSTLSNNQLFHVSLIADLLDKLVLEQIITPTQRGEIKKYILKKLKERDNEKTKK